MRRIRVAEFLVRQPLGVVHDQEVVVEGGHDHPEVHDPQALQAVHVLGLDEEEVGRVGEEWAHRRGLVLRPRLAPVSRVRALVAARGVVVEVRDVHRPAEQLDPRVVGLGGVPVEMHRLFGRDLDVDVARGVQGVAAARVAVEEELVEDAKHRPVLARERHEHLEHVEAATEDRRVGARLVEADDHEHVVGVRHQVGEGVEGGVRARGVPAGEGGRVEAPQRVGLAPHQLEVELIVGAPLLEHLELVLDAFLGEDAVRVVSVPRDGDERRHEPVEERTRRRLVDPNRRGLGVGEERAELWRRERAGIVHRLDDEGVDVRGVRVRPVDRLVGPAGAEEDLLLVERRLAIGRVMDDDARQGRVHPFGRIATLLPAARRTRRVDGVEEVAHPAVGVVAHPVHPVVVDVARPFAVGPQRVHRGGAETDGRRLVDERGERELLVASRDQQGH